MGRHGVGKQILMNLLGTIKNIIFVVLVILLLSVVGRSDTTSIKDNPKTALVLSGGGARALGHIGVLKALERQGFTPDLVVGTSMGAIIGGLYASGVPIKEIEELARNIDYNSFFTNQNYKKIELASQKLTDFPALARMKIDTNMNMHFPKYLYTTQSIRNVIMPYTLPAQYMSGGNFDSLAIPFRVVSTDISSGSTVVSDNGNLAKLISGSSAMPFLLAPVIQDSMRLVDGGLTNNVPCDVAASLGADFIVTSDFTSRKREIPVDATASRLVEQTINTLAYSSDVKNIHLTDLYIRPKVEHVSSTAFQKIDIMIESGYQETKKIIDRLPEYSSEGNDRKDWYRSAQRKLKSTKIDSIGYSLNSSMNKYIIKSENPFNSGDRWSKEKAITSVKNLYSTNLFNSIDLNIVKKGDSTILSYNLKTRAKGRISFGAFYSSELNARAFFSLDYRNFLNSSINNRFYLVTSDRYNKLAWDITAPRILYTNFTNYISTYYIRENIPIYEEEASALYDKTGIDINFGLNVEREALTSVGLLFERINIPKNPELEFIDQNQYYITRLQGQLFVDNRNDYDRPTQGKLTRITYEHSIKNNLSPFMSVGKLSVKTVDYQQLNENFTMVTHLNGGIMNRAHSFFDKFRLGGVNSFPGYHEDALFGKLYFTLGFEGRLQIKNNLYMRGKLVGGNIGEGAEIIQWEESRLGSRLGLSLSTPFGPVSVDIGNCLEKSPLLYFSFGHRF